MQVFYANYEPADTQILIEGQEHLHISKALRKRVGDVINITNGNGLLYNARIDIISKKATSITLLDIIEEQQPTEFDLTIGFAPTKNMARTDFFIEKSIELGVAKIDFFYSSNSERRKIKLDKVEAQTISAMKQSTRLFLPKVEETKSFQNLLIKYKDYGNKFIASCREDSIFLKNCFQPKEKMVCLVGPEGGFTLQEIQMAEMKGFKSISLGRNRLRSETAAIFVAATFKLINE